MDFKSIKVKGEAIRQAPPKSIYLLLVANAERNVVGNCMG